jgi:hypothetical protein
MRTTLIIDEKLLKRASELTGIREKNAFARAGRLADLGGKHPQILNIPRRPSVFRLG